MMSQTDRHNFDAVLGGQTPPPLNAAVLGGEIGIEQELRYRWGLKEKSIERFRFETVFVNASAEIIDRHQNQAFGYTEYIYGIPLELVYIPAGSFWMGGFRELVQPIHQVTLQSFLLGKYPITQQQYLALMGTNPAYFRGDARLPVENVAWGEAMAFCRRLSALTQRKFTLPSESQWEYACRASTETLYCFGAEINADLVNTRTIVSLDERAAGCYPSQTTPVGIYPPNAWGLADLHGNGVWILITMIMLARPMMAVLGSILHLMTIGTMV
jgi:formylglycine-generating enzyme required for sulfatase activity